MKNLLRPAVVLATLATSFVIAAAQDADDVQIRPTQLRPGIYMLEGQGGNMGLSVGADGTFLIDDQFAPLTDKILATIKTITEKPVQFVVNTHWHGDHTGGNENLGNQGSIIVAHTNVRERMSKGQFMAAFNRNVPPAPAKALPVVTFTDEMTFHWNGDDIRVIHVEPAHTDGDSIVLFRKANVLHMGDTFFNGMYPFIDVGSGGSLDGMIAAVERAMPMVNADTKIIPGHGPLANEKDLHAYFAMMRTVRDRVRSMVDSGMTVEAVIDAKPTRGFDEVWGKGFLGVDQWVGIVFAGMTAQQR